MIFQFKHADEICTAYVLYNAFQISDTMIVEFINCPFEIGNEITFVQSGPNVWQCEGEFKYNFPITYINLCEQLSLLFPDHKFQFS